MNEYLVVRKWRVKAKNAADAIAATVPGEHFEVSSKKIPRFDGIKNLIEDYVDASIENSHADGRHPSDYETKRQDMLKSRKELYKKLNEVLL